MAYSAIWRRRRLSLACWAEISCFSSSKVCFGCMRFPMLNPDHRAKQIFWQVERMVHAAPKRNIAMLTLSGASVSPSTGKAQPPRRLELHRAALETAAGRHVGVLWNDGGSLGWGRHDSTVRS